MALISWLPGEGLKQTTSYLMSNVHLNIPNRQHLSVILSPPSYLCPHPGLFSTTHSKIAEIRLNCLKFAGGQAFNQSLC